VAELIMGWLPSFGKVVVGVRFDNFLKVVKSGQPMMR